MTTTPKPEILTQEPPADPRQRQLFDTAKAIAEEQYTQTLLNKRTVDLTPAEQSYLAAGIARWVRENRG